MNVRSQIAMSKHVLFLKNDSNDVKIKRSNLDKFGKYTNQGEFLTIIVMDGFFGLFSPKKCTEYFFLIAQFTINLPCNFYKHIYEKLM